MEVQLPSSVSIFTREKLIPHLLDEHPRDAVLWSPGSGYSEVLEALGSRARRLEELPPALPTDETLVLMRTHLDAEAGTHLQSLVDGGIDEKALTKYLSSGEAVVFCSTSPRESSCRESIPRPS